MNPQEHARTDARTHTHALMHASYLGVHSVVGSALAQRVAPPSDEGRLGALPAPDAERVAGHDVVAARPVEAVHVLVRRPDEVENAGADAERLCHRHSTKTDRYVDK